MAAGCPVIVSDQASLPEIVGDAGQIVKTDDYPSASKYILRLLENPAWEQAERSKVFKYASEVTWHKTVKETVDVYYRVLKAHNTNGNK